MSSGTHDHRQDVADAIERADAATDRAGAWAALCAADAAACALERDVQAAGATAEQMIHQTIGVWNRIDDAQLRFEGKFGQAPRPGRLWY